MLKHNLRETHIMYLLRTERTVMSLFTRSTVPATDAMTSSLSTNVPCPLNVDEHHAGCKHCLCSRTA